MAAAPDRFIDDSSSNVREYQYDALNPTPLLKLRERLVCTAW